MSATATLQEMTNEKLKWNHTHSQLTCKNTPTHFKKEKKNVKGRHKQSHYIYIYIYFTSLYKGRESWGRDGGGLVERQHNNITYYSMDAPDRQLQGANRLNYTLSQIHWEQEDHIHVFAANKIQVCHVSADETDGAFMVLVVSKSTWFGIRLIKNKDQHKMHHVNI